MPRHDCLWNSFILGSLSQITPNISNSEDNITSIAEQSDYDLLFEGWQADKIINTTIPDDPDGIPSAGKIPASSSEIPEDLELLEVRYLGGSDTDKSEKGKKIPPPPSEEVSKSKTLLAPKSLTKNKRKHLQRKAKKLALREYYMQKANYMDVETDPVNMTESNDNSIFYAAANFNPKNASGSSHDCLNKKRSRGEASRKNHSVDEDK